MSLRLRLRVVSFGSQSRVPPRALRSRSSERSAASTRRKLTARDAIEPSHVIKLSSERCQHLRSTQMSKLSRCRRAAWRVPPQCTNTRGRASADRRESSQLRADAHSATPRSRRRPIATSATYIPAHQRIPYASRGQRRALPAAPTPTHQPSALLAPHRVGSSP